MSDPRRPSRRTVVQRAADNLAATKATVLKDVPPLVVERITALARVGILLVIAGMVAALYIVQLVVTTKGADWKVLGILMLIPLLMVAFGANLTSMKATRLAFGSLGAIVRAAAGKGTSDMGGNGA